MTEENKSKLEQLQSMINSLKEIITIIVGLALTNAIIQFLMVGGTVREITEISLGSAVIFILLIINMIRFYHGNFRHLDVTYSSTNFQELASGDIRYHPIEEKVTMDFFLILIESLILCVMSFYQVKPIYFFYIFSGLLIVDIIWFFATYHFVPNREAFQHQKKWAINNIVAIILLLIICSFSVSVDQEILTYASSIVLFANTIGDYRENWHFYFPIPFREKEGKK